MHDDQGHLPDLSPDDQRLLDALVECGFEPDALHLSAADRDRAESIVNLLGLMNDYPVEDADDSLIDATMARVERYERDRESRMRMDAVPQGNGVVGRIRLPDFISVAAVFLIIVGLGLPMVNSVRQSSIDQACQNNMRRLAYAFNTYANDYGGALPVASAGLFPDWRSVSNNIVNLGPLVEHDYCDAGHLNCPGHDSHEGHLDCGYSYQWPSRQAMLNWGIGEGLLLADRNPVIDAYRAGQTASPASLSLNHGGRGQNVLAADGSIFWLDDAYLKGDNIWMPAGVRLLRDGIIISEPGDVFLAH